MQMLVFCLAPKIYWQPAIDAMLRLIEIQLLQLHFAVALIQRIPQLHTLLVLLPLSNKFVKPVRCQREANTTTRMTAC
jgi:hypothetical protein